MKKIYLCLFLLASVTGLLAQTTVSGKVTDENGDALIGANIVEKGTTNGAVSDIDGNFSFSVSSSNATLVVSYIGFRAKDIPLNGSSNVNVVLAEGVELGAVHVVGTRSYQRSATTTPVAVDVIDFREIRARNGNAELNKILQYLVPSFNAQKQSGSDGAEHIDPASLRGLGPDQTLVLINGKRRH